jgi:signal transduction histidine kinase
MTRAREKDLWFSVEVADDVPTSLHGDPNRLQQILINLVGNAIKFTIEVGITLSICRGRKGFLSMKFKIQALASQQTFKRHYLNVSANRIRRPQEHMAARASDYLF